MSADLPSSCCTLLQLQQYSIIFSPVHDHTSTNYTIELAYLVMWFCPSCTFLQVLRHGFFHADPHPGNVSVDASGRLLFYDFGMMGEIVPNVRERLLDLFYGIYK
eukprot:GHUV01046494.1.p1 GENE.GHUV01046494.1~~GHUV01046494.1.p1  ORF type:complete len:105 (-),score=22.01 GHUV01046494.1:54-368(-)